MKSLPKLSFVINSLVCAHTFLSTLLSDFLCVYDVVSPQNVISQNAIFCPNHVKIGLTISLTVVCLAGLSFIQAELSVWSVRRKPLLTVFMDQITLPFGLVVLFYMVEKQHNNVLPLNIFCISFLSWEERRCLGLWVWRVLWQRVHLFE